MFTEILRLIPRLSDADAKKAEVSLTQRFGRVAQRFGHGLKNVIKGTVIGISLGLLSKLLNPLQELEERIKKLLEGADDARDIADKYGSTPGQFLRLQALAQSSGLKPEELQTMMESFRKAVEQERKLIDEGKINSDDAAFSYANDKDLLEGFFTFIQSLKQLGDANPVARRTIERQVFGDTLSGSQRRFVEADFAKEGQGIPTAEAFEKAATNAIIQADIYRRATVRNEAGDFVRSSNAIGGNVIAGMLTREQTQRNKDFEQLQGYEQLKRAADAAQLLTELIAGLQKAVINGLAVIGGKMDSITSFLDKIGPYIPSFLKSYGGKK